MQQFPFSFWNTTQSNISSPAPNPTGSGIVAYYKLNESGNTFIDLVRGFNLTAINTPVSVAGVILVRTPNTSFIARDPAFQCTGYNYLQESNPKINTYFLQYVAETLTFWTYISQTTNTGLLISNTDFSNNGNYVWINGSLNKIFFTQYYTNAGPAQTFTISGNYTPNQWNFITAQVFTEHPIRLSINGNVVASGQIGGQNPIQGSISGLKIGTNFTGSYSGNFIIDEVGIWNKILTSGEVNYLYNNGAGRTYPFN